MVALCLAIVATAGDTLEQTRIEIVRNFPIDDRIDDQEKDNKAQAQPQPQTDEQSRSKRVVNLLKEHDSQTRAVFRSDRGSPRARASHVAC